MEDALRSAGVSYEITQTEAPNHAVELSAQAVQEGFRPIIAAGGDGTISEVINGLVQGCQRTGIDLSEIPFGVMPLGSADDLVDNLKIPKSLPAAAQVIASGKTRRMDLCSVKCEQTLRYFDNNAAIGLEPYITLVQQRITWLHGSLRYLLATLLGVMDKPHWNMQLEWEGGSYEGPITLVTVGNHPRTGGLFYVAPHANGFDGLLTFVYGYMPTRRQIFTLLPRTMKPGEGSYVEHPAIHEANSPGLRIRSQQPTPLHADGEIQSRDAREIEFQALPDKVAILL